MNISEEVVEPVHAPLISGHVYVFDNRKENLRICVDHEGDMLMCDLVSGIVLSKNANSEFYTDVTEQYLLKQVE